MIFFCFTSLHQNKGTVSVVSNNPPRKDGIVRFTTEPRLIKYELDFLFTNSKTDYFQLFVLYKIDSRIFTTGEHGS